MYKEIIVLTLFSTLSNAQLKPLTGWRNCGSPLAILHEVRVTGCTQSPCKFSPGKSYDIEVDATSLTYTKTLRYKITGSYIVHIVLVKGDACNQLTSGKCPATPNDKLSFKMTYVVPKYFPLVKSEVTAVVVDDIGKVGICVTLDVKLING